MNGDILLIESTLTEISSLLREANESGGSWQEIAAQRRNRVQREIEERQACLVTLNSTLACDCGQLVKCPQVDGCPLIAQDSYGERSAVGNEGRGPFRASDRLQSCGR